MIRSCIKYLLGGAVGFLTSIIIAGFAPSSLAIGAEMISVDDLLGDGFEIKAVSESIADEGQGATTRFYLQKAETVYVCGIVGLALGKAMQLFTCHKLNLDTSLMRDIQPSGESN